jgi:ferredoxin-thioredoxin reductase catalytic subunit
MDTKKYKMTDDPEVKMYVTEGLKRNIKKFGRPYCPCLIHNPDSLDPDEICQCKEFREDGICRCGLFVER